MADDQSIPKANVDDRAQAYIDAIGPGQRPLFDRVHGLIVEEFPEVEVGFSYKMPLYNVGRFSLHLGVWKHGLSIYGYEGDAGFVETHPELSSGRGTIRLPVDVAAELPDEELRELFRAALGGVS